jgi:hypothetical protein
MRLYQRPRQIQNTQENHGLMMSAKMPSKIAKMPVEEFCENMWPNLFEMSCSDVNVSCPSFE